MNKVLANSVPEPNSGCILWLGCCFNNGYGCVRYDGKNRTTHRLAWELEFGEIPDGLMVCHKCDVRSCVNTRHMFLGTAQDNVNDMWMKGRGVAPVCSIVERYSALSTDDVLAIRRLAAAGYSQRKIARTFGVTQAAVSDIHRRRRRATVQ